MSRIKAVLVVISCLSGTSAISMPACDVVAALQRIHFAQERLVEAPQRMLASRDRVVLRQGLKSLSPANISYGLGSQINAEQRNLIFQVLDGSQMFLGALDDNNIQLALDIRKNPTNQRRAERVLDILPKFECHTGVQGENGGTSRSASGLTDGFTGEAIAKQLPWLGLVLAIVSGVLWLAIPRIRKKMVTRKQRARRFPLNQSVKYIYKQDIYGGKVVDISCYGLKLQHNTSSASVGDIIDIWMLGDWQKGTVTWSNDVYCGLQFKFPLLVSDIRTLRMYSKNGKAA